MVLGDGSLNRLEEERIPSYGAGTYCPSYVFRRLQGARLPLREKRL